MWNSQLFGQEDGTHKRGSEAVYHVWYAVWELYFIKGDIISRLQALMRH